MGVLEAGGRGTEALVLLSLYLVLFEPKELRTCKANQEKGKAN